METLSIQININTEKSLNKIRNYCKDKQLIIERVDRGKKTFEITSLNNDVMDFYHLATFVAQNHLY